jgi:hypothetical protein
MSTTTYIVVAAIATVLYLLGRVVIAMVKNSGAVEIERDEARRDREDARRQAEIMLQEKTVDDVAKDLEDGSF